MREREKLLARAHAERQCFVQKAIEEGSHTGIAEKTVNIGVAAVFGPSPLAEIGRSYDETRANASLLYRGFIPELWNNSSEQTRSSHTLKDLQARKPISQRSRERLSESRGGKALRIRDMILSGARSVDELKKQSGLSKERIWAGLRTLERRGIDVSQFFSTTRKNKEKIKQLIGEEDDKKIQRMLDELPAIVIRYNMLEPKKRKKRRNPKVFTTIGSTTSGLYYYKFMETHLFAQDLEENGIPNRKMKRVTEEERNDYVLLEKHRDRALAVWDKDPRLERFKTSHPVTIICGNKNMTIPTATQLTHSRKYRSVSSVLSELNIRIHPPRQQRELREWLFENCPITIWAYRHGKYIATSDIDQFKQYFLLKHELLEE